MDGSYFPTCDDSFLEWIQKGDQNDSFDLLTFNDETNLLDFADSDSTVAINQARVSIMEVPTSTTQALNC